MFVVLLKVSSISDAATWLQYTYLYIRMLRNPLAYGISTDQKADDPRLRQRCIQLVKDAAKVLDSNKMLRYDVDSGNLGIANNGRVAAHFYIQTESIATFNDMLLLDKHLSVESLCRVICSASEFQNIKVRQEEMEELQNLMRDACYLQIKGAGSDDEGYGLITSAVDKAFILLQAYISRASIRSFTLISDTNYVASNAGRVTRALFEICLKSENAGSALQLLRIAKSIEHQFWWFQTPLRHFDSELHEGILKALENGANKHRQDMLDEAFSLLEMQPDEVGSLCKINRQGGAKVLAFVRMLPKLQISYIVKPVIGSVLKLLIDIELDFEWNSRWHGGSQSFWIWVENETSDKILHHEHISLVRKSLMGSTQIEFSIPLFNSKAQQYIIRVTSDGWVGIEQIVLIPLNEITMPTDKIMPTNLMDLTPLTKSVLQHPIYEQVYSKLKIFNPVSTTVIPVQETLCPV
jgi:activating signal cointegrator complex subunit 3